MMKSHISCSHWGCLWRCLSWLDKQLIPKKSHDHIWHGEGKKGNKTENSPKEREM